MYAKHQNTINLVMYHTKLSGNTICRLVVDSYFKRWWNIARYTNRVSPVSKFDKSMLLGLIRNSWGPPAIGNCQISIFENLKTFPLKLRSFSSWKSAYHSAGGPVSVIGQMVLCLSKMWIVFILNMAVKHFFLTQNQCKKLTFFILGKVKNFQDMLVARCTRKYKNNFQQFV